MKLEKGYILHVQTAGDGKRYTHTHSPAMPNYAIVICSQRRFYEYSRNIKNRWLLLRHIHNSHLECLKFPAKSMYPEVVCTVRLAIGFKQMVCTVATCYWFQRCFGFTKPEAFFPLNITTVPLNIAQSFFYLY